MTCYGDTFGIIGFKNTHYTLLQENTTDWLLNGN